MKSYVNFRTGLTKLQIPTALSLIIVFLVASSACVRTEYVHVPIHTKPAEPKFIPCRMPDVERLPETWGGMVAGEKELKWAIEKCNRQNEVSNVKRN